MNIHKISGFIIVLLLLNVSVAFGFFQDKIIPTTMIIYQNGNGTGGGNTTNYNNISIYNISIYNTSIYNISIYNISVYNTSIYNISVYNTSIYNTSIYNISVYNITNISNYYNITNITIVNSSGGIANVDWTSVAFENRTNDFRNYTQLFNYLMLENIYDTTSTIQATLNGTGFHFTKKVQIGGIAEYPSQLFVKSDDAVIACTGTFGSNSCSLMASQIYPCNFVDGCEFGSCSGSPSCSFETSETCNAYSPICTWGGGVPPNCYGERESCDSWDGDGNEGLCTAEGCSNTAGYCTGGSGDCCDTATCATQGECESCSGGAGSWTASDCYGSATPCSSYGESTCTSHNYCSWDGGSADYCQILGTCDQATESTFCGDTGCTWTNESGICNGNMISQDCAQIPNAGNCTADLTSYSCSSSVVSDIATIRAKAGVGQTSAVYQCEDTGDVVYDLVSSDCQTIQSVDFYATNKYCINSDCSGYMGKGTAGTGNADGMDIWANSAGGIQITVAGKFLFYGAGNSYTTIRGANNYRAGIAIGENSYTNLTLIIGTGDGVLDNFNYIASGSIGSGTASVNVWNGSKKLRIVGGMQQSSTTAQRSYQKGTDLDIFYERVNISNNITINGVAKIFNNSLPACSATFKGTLAVNGSWSLSYCDGIAWSSMGGAGASYGGEAAVRQSIIGNFSNLSFQVDGRINGNISNLSISSLRQSVVGNITNLTANVKDWMAKNNTNITADYKIRIDWKYNNITNGTGGINVRNISAIAVNTALVNATNILATGSINASLIVGSGSTFPTILSERTSSETNTVLSSMGVRHITSGDMLDGFGSGFTFQAKDSSGVINTLAAIYGVRNGGDTSGDLVFKPYVSGTGTERLKITTGGLITAQDRFNISSTTGNAITTGNVTANYFIGNGSLLTNIQSTPNINGTDISVGLVNAQLVKGTSANITGPIYIDDSYDEGLSRFYGSGYGYYFFMNRGSNYISFNSYSGVMRMQTADSLIQIPNDLDMDSHHISGIATLYAVNGTFYKNVSAIAVNTRTINITKAQIANQSLGVCGSTPQLAVNNTGLYFCNRTEWKLVMT